MNQPQEIRSIATSKDLERCPFPIPLGWYAVEVAERLAVGEVSTIQCFDQEWVLFRGEDGSVGMSDPFCPHLGAHLGKGGEVVGNNIRCPFHHWQYDRDGWCKDIPYAKNMPKICEQQAVLHTLPVQERYGLIWAWYHPDGADPSFEIPDVPGLESDEYVAPILGEWVIDTCIQELGENSVDCPHIKYLHGAPVMPDGVSSTEGHIFNFDIFVGDLMKVLGKSYGPAIQVIDHVHGDYKILMFAIPLPITTEQTMSRYLFTYKKYPEGSAEQIMCKQIYDQAIGYSELENGAGFSEVDIPVWNNKRYRDKPILCDGDGPIAQWRKYFRQFYAELEP